MFAPSHAALAFVASGTPLPEVSTPSSSSDSSEEMSIRLSSSELEEVWEDSLSLASSGNNSGMLVKESPLFHKSLRFCRSVAYASSWPFWLLPRLDFRWLFVRSGSGSGGEGGAAGSNEWERYARVWPVPCKNAAAAAVVVCAAPDDTRLHSQLLVRGVSASNNSSSGLVKKSYCLSIAAHSCAVLGRT